MSNDFDELLGSLSTDTNPKPKPKKIYYTDLVKSGLINPADPNLTQTTMREIGRQGYELVFDKENVNNILKTKGASDKDIEKLEKEHQELYKYILANSKNSSLSFSFTPQGKSSIQETLAKSIQDNAKLGQSTLLYGKELEQKERGYNIDQRAITGSFYEKQGNTGVYLDKDGNIKTGNPYDEVSYWDNYLNLFEQGAKYTTPYGLFTSKNSLEDNKYLTLATNAEYYDAYFKKNPQEKQAIIEQYGSLENYFNEKGINPNAIYEDNFGRGIFKVTDALSLAQDPLGRQAEVSQSTLDQYSGFWNVASSFGEGFLRFVPTAANALGNLGYDIAGLFSEPMAQEAMRRHKLTDLENQGATSVQSALQNEHFWKNAKGDFSFTNTLSVLARLGGEAASTFGVGTTVKLGGKLLGWGASGIGRVITPYARTIIPSALRNSAKQATKYLNINSNSVARFLSSELYTLQSYEQGYNLAMNNGYTHNEAVSLATLYGAVTSATQRMLGNPITRQLFPENKELQKAVTKVITDMAPAYTEAMRKVTTKAEEEIVKKSFAQKALGLVKKSFKALSKNDMIAEGMQEALEYALQQGSNFALNKYDDLVLGNERRDLDDDISLKELLGNFLIASAFSGILSLGKYAKNKITNTNRLKGLNDFNTFNELASYYVANDREGELLQELYNMKEQGLLGAKGISILGNITEKGGKTKFEEQDSNEYMYDWAVRQISALSGLKKKFKNSIGKEELKKLSKDERYSHLSKYVDELYGIEEDKRGQGEGLAKLEKELTENYINNRTSIIDNYMRFVQEDINEKGEKNKKAAIVVEDSGGKKLVKEYENNGFVEYDANRHVLVEDYANFSSMRLKANEANQLSRIFGDEADFLEKNGGVNVSEEELDKFYNARKKEIEKRKEEIENEKKEIENIVADKKTLEEKQLELEGLNKQLNKLNKIKEIKQKENDIKNLKELLSSATDENRKKAIQDNINTFEKQLSDLKTSLDNSEYKGDIEKDLEQVRNKIQSLSKEIDTINNRKSLLNDLEKEDKELILQAKELEDFYKEVKENSKSINLDESVIPNENNGYTSLLSAIKDVLNIPIGNKEKQESKANTGSNTNTGSNIKQVYTIPKKYITNAKGGVINSDKVNVEFGKARKKTGKQKTSFAINSDLNEGFFGKITIKQNEQNPFGEDRAKINALFAILKAYRENRNLLYATLKRLEKDAAIYNLVNKINKALSDAGNSTTVTYQDIVGYGEEQYKLFADIIEQDKAIRKEYEKINEEVAKKVEEINKEIAKITNNNIDEKIEAIKANNIDAYTINTIVKLSNELEDLLNSLDKEIEEVEIEINGNKTKLKKTLSEENKENIFKIIKSLFELSDAINYSLSINNLEETEINNLNENIISNLSKNTKDKLNIINQKKAENTPETNNQNELENILKTVVQEIEKEIKNLLDNTIKKFGGVSTKLLEIPTTLESYVLNAFALKMGAFKEGEEYEGFYKFDFKRALSNILNKIKEDGVEALTAGDNNILSFIRDSRSFFNTSNAIATIISGKLYEKHRELSRFALYPEVSAGDFRDYYNKTGDENSILNIFDSIEQEIALSRDVRNERILTEAKSYLENAIKDMLSIDKLVNIPKSNGETTANIAIDFINIAGQLIRDANIADEFTKLYKDSDKGSDVESKIYAYEKIYVALQNAINQAFNSVKDKITNENEADFFEKVTTIVYSPDNKIPDKDKVENTFKKAKTLMNAIYYPRTNFIVDLQKALENNKSGITPTLEQINFLYESIAYTEISDNVKNKLKKLNINHNIIHGEAGSGKTTMIDIMIGIKLSLKRRKDPNAKLVIAYSTFGETLYKKWMDEAGKKYSKDDVEIIGVDVKIDFNGNLVDAREDLVEAFNKATTGKEKSEIDLFFIDEYTLFNSLKDEINSEKGAFSSVQNVILLGDKYQISLSDEDLISINSVNEIKTPFRSGSVENYNFNSFVKQLSIESKENNHYHPFLSKFNELPATRYNDEYGVEVRNAEGKDNSQLLAEFESTANLDKNGVLIRSHENIAELAKKVQGLSYDTVYLLLENAEGYEGQFNMRLLYTALTRAKKKVIIYNNTGTAIKPSVEDNNIALFSDIKKASEKIKSQAKGLFDTYREIIEKNVDKGNTNNTNTNTGNTSTGNTSTDNTKREDTGDNDNTPLEVPIIDDSQTSNQTEKASEISSIVTSEAEKLGLLPSGNVTETKTEEQLQEEAEDIELKENLEVNEQEVISSVEELENNNNKGEKPLPNAKDVLEELRELLEVIHKQVIEVKKEKKIITSNGINTEVSEYIAVLENGTRIVISENELEKNLEELRGKAKAKKESEFNEFLAKVNSEQSKVVFSTLYVPEDLYNSDERDNNLLQIANRINKNEIVGGEYKTINGERKIVGGEHKIVKTKLINILTGEEVEEGYALYDNNGKYIASIWENVVKGSGTRAKQIVSKFPISGNVKKADEEVKVEVNLANPEKILPLSLSVSLNPETKTLTEVVKNLKSLGYIVHPNLLISDSGDVALLFFNSQDSYDKFVKATKNLKSYEEYKEWLETGNETKNKHGVGFIFFRERSPNNKRRPDSFLTLAESIAVYMLETLQSHSTKSIDKKKPEEKKQYIRDMREFFSLSRFVQYNLNRDENGNIIGVDFKLNWYGHLFLKLLSEERYKSKTPSGFYKVYLPNNIKLSEDIVLEEDEDGDKYIKVPYYSKADNSDDFVLDMMAKIDTYIKKIKEIIKSDVEGGEVAKEKMIKSIMNSAVVTKSFTDAILKVYKNGSFDVKLGYIIEKANLQYNAVRGDTFFHNKKINEIGSFFETSVMMPMPYLSAEIEIKEISGNTTTATPEQEKNDCTLGIEKGKSGIKKKNKL